MQALNWQPSCECADGRTRQAARPACPCAEWAEWVVQLEPRQLLSAAGSPNAGDLFDLGLTTTNSSDVLEIAGAFDGLGPRMRIGQVLAGRDFAASSMYTPSASQSLMRLASVRNDARFASLEGQGFATVIIDTGINLRHSFFGPDADGNGVADRIVYQYDFADGDADAIDRNGHGSNVASIAASSSLSLPGVAPRASIIVLKVFTDGGAGNFGFVERALQWVVANVTRYNIASVNMSLGDNGNYTTRTARAGIGDELAALAQRNVIVAAAAGNSYYSLGSRTGLAYPAADPSTIAVGAVFASNIGRVRYGDGAQADASAADVIAPFSQRWSGMDVFAPGTAVAGAAATGSGTVVMHGTSQAAPQIAGLAVLAQQLAMQTIGRRLDVGEFRSMIASTAVTIIDGDDELDNVTNTSSTFRRVDAAALLERILSLGGPAQGNDPNDGSEAPVGTPAAVNRAPTMTTMSGLAGAVLGRAALVSHAMLALAANESDADGDAVSFRISSLATGSVYSMGGLRLAPGAELHAGQAWIWLPGATVGWQRAFTLAATDRQLASSTPVALWIRVDAPALQPGSTARASPSNGIGARSGLGSSSTDVSGENAAVISVAIGAQPPREQNGVERAAQARQPQGSLYPAQFAQRVPGVSEIGATWLAAGPVAAHATDGVNLRGNVAAGGSLFLAAA